MNKTARVLLVPSLMLLGVGSSQAALVYSHDFTGGADSWAMIGGGTMTTQDLTSTYVDTNSAMSFLIQQISGNTDAQTGTISAWFKLPASNASNLFTAHTNFGTTSSTNITNYTGYSLLTDITGNLSVSQTGNSTGTLATAGTAWTMVTLAVTKENSNRLIDVSLYLNGNLWGGGSTPTDFIAGSNFNGNAFQSLVMGGAGISVGGLQVYNTALDSTTIAGLYAAQVAAVPEPTTYGLLGAGMLAGCAFVRRRRRVGIL